MITPFRTRLAPTPSGYLHIGNALNFLIAWKLARNEKGRVLLRIDDLDADRMRPEYVADIFDLLQWLDIDWDEGPRDAADFHRNWSQRRKLGRYQALLDDLRRSGHLFACTCSRKELATCTCRNRGRPFDAPQTAWRLRVDDPCAIVLREWPSGNTLLDLQALLPDPVVRKRDGEPAYQIASLADDLDLGVNVIVRGSDLLPSSACQAHLARSLGLDAFAEVRFLHHPLITDTHGKKLSKSAGALKTLRGSGADPNELHALAGRMLHDLVRR